MIDRRALKAELRCLNCGRLGGTAVQMPWGLVVTPQPDADPEAVKRLACTRCGGRLWAEYIQTDYVYSRTAAAEMERLPRRGRPPKAMPEGVAL